MLNPDPFEDLAKGPLPDNEDTYHDVDFRAALEMGQPEGSKRGGKPVADVDNVRY